MKATLRRLFNVPCNYSWEEARASAFAGRSPRGPFRHTRSNGEEARQCPGCGYYFNEISFDFPHGASRVVRSHWKDVDMGRALLEWERAKEEAVKELIARQQLAKARDEAVSRIHFEDLASSNPELYEHLVRTNTLEFVAPCPSCGSYDVAYRGRGALFSPHRCRGCGRSIECRGTSCKFVHVKYLH